ncbi:BMP family ABC transporter substrate-binding protein [Halobacillus andaensis]|uniref:BMP family ABC transporter substrate-binding protein n=1 Tax=Halobacillus andaensis TaxID=1176239 RepID=A0A917BDI4_HALAA|nr:BMP family ABC transporter substrate-binding protein [Halobacillus andaensis]MBP2006219.1 basic membrane protein A [Halobacillus andaensis]GGF33365.1 BMP family ABC transporter substrate-binding protein [Halobacillus andaensis]
MSACRWFGLLFLCFVVAGCSSEEADSASAEKGISAGLLVTESGLGDDSFSDSAFQGLEQARDELGITFDYREPFNGDFEGHMEDLIEQGHDVIMGLGYDSQASIDALAEKYPDQQFVLIDAVSEFDNVTSITFREDEGSYLIGLLAGMKTESDVVGFIGGEQIEVVERFENGFRDGVQEVNDNAEVLVEYAGTFDDDAKGADLTRELTEDKADYVFHAAGFTGVGVMKEAENLGIYAFGADSDQYYVAEDAVVSSMMKNVNVALYDVMAQLTEGEPLKGGLQELGIEEEGVGLAPIRLIQLSDEEQDRIDEEVN